MNIVSMNEYLRIATHVVTILGLPLAVFLFCPEGSGLITKSKK